MVLDRLGRDPGLDAISAVGHRVAHGGDRFAGPARISPEWIEGLRRIASLDPEHLLGEVALIEAFGRAMPAVP